LNGRSLGQKSVVDRLEPVLRWDVPNEAGTVQVIGRRDGRDAARFELTTAGAPRRLQLIPERTELAADSQDLVAMEIRVVDAAGRRVFAANLPIAVRVTGSAELVALDTANPLDITPVNAASGVQWRAVFWRSCAPTAAREP
jgi:beta-galactosidase